MKDKKGVIQEESARLSRLYPDLILEHCTGLGKTRSLLKCIDSSTSLKGWLVLVPEINLIENFRKDIIKHGYEHLLEKKIVDIICYASLNKWEGTDLNLGFDEGHHISDLRLEHIQTITSDQRILLSATIPREVRNRLSTVGNWYTYKVSLQEGIDLGILPEPEIFVKYINLDNKILRNIWKFGKNPVSLTDKQYYQQLDKKVDYWKNRYQLENQEFLRKKWFMASIERKRWMGECKTEYIKDLLVDNTDRLICFCSSLQQAQELGGKQSVHSKNTSKENQAIITNFNNLESSRLFSCSMLREGMNLENIDSGYIVQLPGNTKEVVQSVGRILRGLAPKIYITVLRDTKDEDYLNNALKLFNRQIKTI